LKSPASTPSIGLPANKNSAWFFLIIRGNVAVVVFLPSVNSIAIVKDSASNAANGSPPCMVGTPNILKLGLSPLITSRLSHEGPFTML